MCTAHPQGRTWGSATSSPRTALGCGQPALPVPAHLPYPGQREARASLIPRLCGCHEGELVLDQELQTPWPTGADRWWPQARLREVGLGGGPRLGCGISTCPCTCLASTQTHCGQIF